MPTIQPSQSAPSFVPKKASIRKKSQATSIAVLVSFLIFVISAGSAVGSFFYHRLLKQRLEGKKAEAAEIEKNIDVREAEELIRLSKRISYSKELLNNHTSVTPLFKEIEKVTLPSIQFTSFEIDKNKIPASLSLNGNARGYPSIALQSDELGKSTVFKNPIFSSFKDGDNGSVEFELTMEVDPTVFNFSTQ